MISAHPITVIDIKSKKLDFAKRIGASHTINYNTGLTNYKIDIPETFIAVDGMSASININPESDTKIDNLIAPFVMVDYLIKT